MDKVFSKVDMYLTLKNVFELLRGTEGLIPVLKKIDIEALSAEEYAGLHTAVVAMSSLQGSVVLTLESLGSEIEEDLQEIPKDAVIQ